MRRKALARGFSGEGVLRRSRPPHKGTIIARARTRRARSPGPSETGYRLSLLPGPASPSPAGRATRSGGAGGGAARPAANMARQRT
uniref:Predicted protein n=1 Tax=Hordeum vulgare subsp. vulgare TaxID=112509 RepID=F2DV44_HORVV|nr:predicted protein [Hordeum vulgare subsp. vulgare]